MSAYSSSSSVLTLRRLSVLGAILTGLLAVFVYRIQTSFTLLAIGAAAGFALYALLGRVPDAKHNSLDALPGESVRPGLFTLGFLLSNAVAVFALSEAYYDKPLVYYVGIAVAAGFLALRIILTDAHTTNAVLAFVYGVNTFVTNQIAFPLGLNGPDIGDHIGLATTIAETAHITAGGVYEGFPAQHVLAASAALASGTPVPETYRFIGIFGMVLTIPATFLIARQFGSRRFAVFSMIVVASMEYVVYRAGHPSKLAYALTFLVFTFVTVTYLNSKRSPAVLILFALFSTALIFTHHHTAFVTLVLLGTLGIGQQLLSRLRGVLSNRPSFTDGGIPEREVVEATTENSRTHVLALLFAIAFITQFLYFAEFYTHLVSIASQYVDVLFVTGGPNSVKETPRFSTIPLQAIFINTIGSGLLAALAVVGVLHQFERRVRFAYVLFGWILIAAVLMVGGVVFNVPFALPNRVYVITELTGAGLFAAAGFVYLVRQSEARRVGKLMVGFVIVLVVGFTLFSTASTIAGIETSPFNEDVPHRTWYGMVEEDAASTFASEHGLAEIEYARGFPVNTTTRQLDYGAATEGDVVSLNLHKIRAGVNVGGGSGRIGTGLWFIPDEPRAGLTDESKLYDNGAIELYQVDG